MLPHHRPWKAAPEPPRPPQGIHSDAHEGDEEPQGAHEGAGRRSADQEDLPDRGRGEGLPQIRPQPLHRPVRSREAQEDNRREGRHAPEEEQGRGGRHGPRRVVHQGVEHTPPQGRQERILRPGRQGGEEREDLRPGVQAPRLRGPPADTPSGQRAGASEREREEARPHAGREDQGGPPEGRCEAEEPGG